MYESGTLFLPAAHHWTGREGYTPRYIVLHGTAGGTSAQGIAQFFAEQSTQASSHYIIGQDGTLVCTVAEENAAWSNGAVTGQRGTSGDGYGNGFHDWWWESGINPNLISLAIEHVKPSADNSDGLTDEQRQASFRLIAHLCERYSIPKRKADSSGGITGHYAIDPINRARCPGNYPWDDLWQYLNETASGGGEENVVLQIEQTCGYFEEVVKDQRWHCRPTNQDVAYAILQYYRTCTNTALNGLSQFGLPLSGEQHVPNTKQATAQRFERGIVVYDPANEVDKVPGLTGPCYPAHIDKPLVGKGQ